MRRFITPTLAALLAAAITGGLAMADRGSHSARHFGEFDRPYAIGLWGDLPYSPTQATVGVPNLIADMNSQDLAFTAHDGDIKSGSTECADAVYQQALSYFNSLRAPAVFTPGDNDWVDCDRTPGYNDRVQLDKERQLFFSTPFTLGQHRLRQEVQQTPLCLAANGSTPCVENRRWTARRRDLRDAERPGHVQQPVRQQGRRRGCRPAGVRGTQRGGHRLDAGHVRRGAGAALSGGDVHLAGRSGLQRRPGAGRADAQSGDAGRGRRADGWIPRFPERAARPGDRVSQTGRLRPWRLALLPDRQAVPERRRGSGWRTSRGWRPSATTRRTATTTSTG